MNTRKLGTIEVSPIGMGCMGFSHGYGEIPARDYSIQAIRRAHAFGCTFFDTAESYGPNLLPENRGHNERIVGEAVHDFRRQVVLATKLHLDAAEVSAKGLETVMREHLAASLERLQTDYADLYYLHRINPDIPVEDVAQVMGKLIRDGLIRGWGLSQVDVDTIQRAHGVTPPVGSAEHLLHAGARRGGGGHPLLPRPQHRAGALLPHRQRIPLRKSDRPIPTFPTATTCGNSSPSSAKKIWRPTSPFWTYWSSMPPGKTPPRPRSP